MNWDELTPDERNALVAEHTFGYTVRRAVATYDGMDMPWMVFKDQNGVSQRTTDYSTNIADAWLVVGLFAQYEIEGTGAGPHTCCLWTDDGTYGRGNGALLSEAICLAALRAKGIEV